MGGGPRWRARAEGLPVEVEGPGRRTPVEGPGGGPRAEDPRGGPPWRTLGGGPRRRAPVEGPWWRRRPRAEHLGGGPRRRWRPRVEGPGLPYAFSALYLVMFICAALPCFSEKSEKMVAVWSRRAD